MSEADEFGPGGTFESGPQAEVRRPPCEECARHGRSYPEDAIWRLSVISPPDAVDAIDVKQLCTEHAQLLAETYIGYGWGVLVLALAEINVRGESDA